MSAELDPRVEARRGIGAVLQWLEEVPRPIHGVLIIGLIAAITGVDFVTSSLVSLTVFYLIPVVWATWILGRRAGLAVAVLTAVAWSVVERSQTLVYFPLAISGWNVLARLVAFIFVALLLSELRQLSEMRRQLAYSDPLTGIANARILQAHLEREIDRLRRYGHPFAFAYVDLDRFKAVNDSLGHKAGDDVLRRVALALAESVREIDTVARLGGDEFAILMPETGEPAARLAVGRVIAAVDASVRSGAPTVEGLGATSGVIVFTGVPRSADHVIGLADALMYGGKQEGRGRVLFEVYDKGVAREEPAR